MNKFIYTMMTILAFNTAANDTHAPMHLPLELTLKESQNLLKTVNEKGGLTDANPFIALSIQAGEKMSLWLKTINEARSEDNQIRLTSKSTRGGIPIDKPSQYGPSTIEEKYKELKKNLPKEISDVVLGKGAVSAKLPTDEETLVKNFRIISKAYQSAVRWKGTSRWLPWYTENKKRDVRGFYHLKKIESLDEKLDQFSSLDQSEQETLKAHLIGICINKAYKPELCKKELMNAINRNLVKTYKNVFWKYAEAAWKSFFEIDNPREDIHWPLDRPHLMEITFLDPNNDTIKNWLKENIEDEFKRPELDWSLQMSFSSERSPGISFLKFEPNVTPHVSEGNIIVMDANTPIEEYEVKWTIRHEYGHILRLPDCYVEFYDKEKELMINYQLDTTDLMCSRAGDMNDRIYEELKKVYHK